MRSTYLTYVKVIIYYGLHFTINLPTMLILQKSKKSYLKQNQSEKF